MRSKQMVDVILEATARVLSRDGYAAMNTNRVAAVAGVSNRLRFVEEVKSQLALGLKMKTQEKTKVRPWCVFP